MAYADILRQPESKERLDSLLNRLIAERDNVSPKMISVEYIRNRREKDIYPNTRYNTCSKYGGYDPVGLKFYTLNELEELEKKVDKRIKKLLST